MKKYVLIIIGLLCAHLANATSPLNQNYGEVSWGGGFFNIKLPYDANVVNTIYQDKNGMIWIGTKRGLINYNGFNYHLCYYGKNMPDENTIQAITQVGTFLYVGTDNGIRKLNLATWKFEQTDGELSKVTAVRALTVFDGKLWIGTRDKGLFHYDLKTRKLRNLGTYPFSRKLIYVLLPIANQLFVGSYGGLGVYNKTTRKMSTIKQTLLGDFVVNSLAYDNKHHCIWIGTDGKLLRYDLSSASIQVAKEISGTFLKSILLDAQGNRLLIGTEIGLLRYDINTSSIELQEHDTHNPLSLCNNLIYSLYQDRHHNLWVATDNGISMAQQSSLFRKIKLSDMTNSSKGNLFTCMLALANGEYWLGGENGLIHIENNQTHWYSTDNEDFKLVNNNIRAIYCDKSNQIWIATDGGVAKLNPITHQFVYYKIGNRSNNTNWAYGIQEDSMHRMWIATYMSGLIVIDKEVLEKSDKTACALHSNNFVGKGDIASVYQLHSDNKGKIWANTDKGLVCVNPLRRTYKKEHIYLDNFICDGNSIWLSDQGSIYKYNPQTAQKRKLDYKVAYGSVYSMACDQEKLWLSSVDGISYVDKKTLTTFPYSAEDAQYKSCTYDSAKHRMLFGGEDCIATLNLNKLGAAHDKKSASITAISCDTLLMPVTGSKQGNIKLKDFRNIVIELASSDYNTQGEVFYYKWEKDEEWKKLKVDNNLLEYPVMPSGRNILMISMTNPEQDKSALISTYCFDVPFPWYLSRWAWCSYALLLTSVIILVLRIQKRKSERLYERKAKEKTQELTKMKMDFFVNVSHELKTPLSLIIAPIGKLLSECTNAKMRETLHGIHRNALKLNELVYKIIDDQKAEYETENSVLRSHVELVSLINNCILNFRPIITEKAIVVNFSHRAKELWLNVDVIKIETVFTNLLSNAIKHVANKLGEINIELLIEEGEIIVSVKDNGCGIPAPELPLIFIKHYQGKTENKENHGTGIGLFLVKKYTELHGGKVLVSNEDGAVFTITLPLAANKIEERSTTTESTVTDSPAESSLPVVLVIDDNEEVVDFLCSSLSKNYKCLKAFDGKEALAVLQKRLPDLLIVDQMMPTMNGLDFVKAVRRETQTETIPVIMLTAKDDFDTEMKSIKAGVDVFIAKPFDFNKLLLQVARLIKRTQSIQKNTHIEKMLQAPSIEEKGNMETADELFMKELLKAIEENMDKEGYNVSMISEELKIDQKQLYRKVKQLTGKTPVNFLRTMRLKRAAELLKQNRFTISEVMYMVGISNASYFTKCFSAEFGITPKQFVQEHSS